MIFDAHLDMAWNACEWNCDLALPVEQIREAERRSNHLHTGDCTVSWHELRNGGVGLIIATLLPRLNRPQSVLTRFNSREAAYASATGQLYYYRALAETGTIRIIDDLNALEDHLSNWTPDNLEAATGIVLSMEGSDSVLTPDQLHDWHADGLRLLGPAHFGEGPYCFGTGTKGGLRQDGPALLQAMEEIGIILDVTHLCDQSFHEVLDQYSGPVIASHHNCRAIAPGERQFSDHQIKLLIERNAVIGASFDSWMIKPNFQAGVTDPRDVCMNDVAEHIDHICQLAGNANHCGLGTDLDGGHGKESVPHDLETIADLGTFGACLSQRGFSSSQVNQIMSGNFVEFFRKHWKQRPTAEPQSQAFQTAVGRTAAVS